MFRAACLVPVIMVLLLVSVGCKSMTEFQEPWKVYGALGYQWYTTESGGDEITQDSGAVVGMGVEWTVPTMLSRFRLGGLFGVGMERDLEEDPGATGDMSYGAAMAEYNLIYPLSLKGDDGKESSLLIPYIGTGVRYDARDADPLEDNGFVIVEAREEELFTWYLMGGADWAWHVEEDMDLVAGAEFGWTINSDLDITTETGEVTGLEPRGGARVRLSIGLDWGQTELTLIYNYIRLLESDSKNGFSYPENELSQISLAFGWQF